MISMPRAKNFTTTEYKEFIPNTTHKICSVYPRDIHVSNHNGSYTIPGKPEDADYGFVEVRPGLEKRDLGDGHYLSFLTIPAKEIAEDFIGIPQGDTQFLDRGIFVPEKKDPTPAEVQAAKERLFKWAETQVQKADITWTQRGSIKDIVDDAKIAAKMLKVEREWADSWTAKEIVICPACGERLNKGARIHAVGQGGCGERIEWNPDGSPYWPGDTQGRGKQLETPDIRPAQVRR